MITNYISQEIIKILSDKGWIRISELKKNTKIGRLTNEKKINLFKIL